MGEIAHDNQRGLGGYQGEDTTDETRRDETEAHGALCDSVLRQLRFTSTSGAWTSWCRASDVSVEISSCGLISEKSE